MAPGKRVHIVYTAKSCKGEKANSRRFQMGTHQLGEPTLRENIGPPGSLEVGVGLTTQPVEPTCYEIGRRNSRTDLSTTTWQTFKGFEDWNMECFNTL